MLILRLIGGDSSGEVTLFESKGEDRPPSNYWIYKKKSKKLRFAYVLVSAYDGIFTYQYAGRDDDSLCDHTVRINNHDFDETGSGFEMDC